MLQDSITAFIRPVSSSPDGEPNTEPLQSTTLNVPQCYLCDQPARHVYETMAFKWLGRDWPSEPRRLCDRHMRAACGLLVEEPDIRAEVERDYVDGLLYDDKPYYSRADEEADIANAAYWDEVARGGQVA